MTLSDEILKRTARRCREKSLIIPTYAQMRNPELIPAAIRHEVAQTDINAVDPRNLFRITWKNDPEGGGYHGVNYLELPPQLTGVPVPIVGLIGKHFPTGAHKVGATFGCLVPELVNGRFDPETQKAVWPSTGNYCRGGAFNSALLDVHSIAILPEEMSRERFEWLREIGSEVIATPGCESNVKEIYDKCHELLATRDDVVIFNQFDQFGNGMWHYQLTGPAIEEVYHADFSDRNPTLFISATGSAGTIAAGDWLKEKFPRLKIVASEALQCPTIYASGFGGHRIEGIGDKHIPWIHNVRNTDAVAAIDDQDCLEILQLFNTAAGREVLLGAGVAEETVQALPLLGISSISNLLSAVKAARYFELTERDLIFTIFTDSAQMYESRVGELEAVAPCDTARAGLILERPLRGQRTDWFKELNYRDRQQVHNLKYFTWIEQQGKEVEELNRQWYDPGYWDEKFRGVEELDRRIESFNALVAAG